METVQDLFTRADYLRLPEGFPAELLEGCLVKEPSPTYGHQRILATVLQRLLALVGPSRALPAPVEVGIDELNVFQPDVAVLRRLPPLDSSDVGIPLLVVEVLSPSTGERDREVKTHHYLEAGVAEVWLVDPEAESVEIHARDGVTTARGREAARSVALPGFDLTPEVLFSPP